VTADVERRIQVDDQTRRRLAAVGRVGHEAAREAIHLLENLRLHGRALGVALDPPDYFDRDPSPSFTVEALHHAPKGPRARVPEDLVPIDQRVAPTALVVPRGVVRRPGRLLVLLVLLAVSSRRRRPRRRPRVVLLAAMIGVVALVQAAAAAVTQKKTVVGASSSSLVVVVVVVLLQKSPVFFVGRAAMVSAASLQDVGVLSLTTSDVPTSVSSCWKEGGKKRPLCNVRDSGTSSS